MQFTELQLQSVLVVGEQKVSDGAVINARGMRDGSTAITVVRGKYTEATMRGNMFFSYSAARAMTVPAAIMVGNIVWNPPESGVILALGPWTGQIEVTSATNFGVSLAYAAQAITPTTLTAINSSGSCLLNASSPSLSKAKAYAGGTLLVTPTVVQNLFHGTAAIAATGVDQIGGDFEGLWTVSPGYAVCLAAYVAAIAAAGFTSTLTWEEIPV